MKIETRRVPGDLNVSAGDTSRFSHGKSHVISSTESTVLDVINSANPLRVRARRVCHAAAANSCIAREGS